MYANILKLSLRRLFSLRYQKGGWKMTLFWKLDSAIHAKLCKSWVGETTIFTDVPEQLTGNFPNCCYKSECGSCYCYPITGVLQVKFPPFFRKLVKYLFGSFKYSLYKDITCWGYFSQFFFPLHGFDLAFRYFKSFRGGLSYDHVVGY